MSFFPTQKLTWAEKLKREQPTQRNNLEQSVDYFIDESRWEYEDEELLKLSNFADGDVVDEQHYEFVLNPYNTTIDKYKRFGAKLRMYNIIRPVVELYVGEYGKRFKNVQVLDVNPDDENRYKEGLKQLVEQHLVSELNNKLLQNNIDTGKESKEDVPLEEKVEEYNKSFDSTRVITGQEVLDYIRFDQDTVDKYTDAYKNFIVYGRTFTYKNIFHDDVGLEVVPVWEMRFPKNLKSNFIEDASYVTRRQIMQPNEILDLFKDKLSDDTLTWLDEQSNTEFSNTNASYTRVNTYWVSDKDDYRRYSLYREAEGVPVYHCQFRSWEKIGILIYLHPIYGEMEMEVDDTYKLNKEFGDISINWVWQSVIIEGWRIEDKQYIDVRKLPYNRAELNNSSEQKLSYNGRVLRTTDGEITSLVKVGINYQILYNIVHYQMEKTINKNQSKITVMPQGLIPKGINGWDEEKFLYFTHAHDLMVIDETSDTANLALQGLKILDKSLSNYINELYNIMNQLKTEWWENIGMNRQRFGDIKASDGKGVSEQAIVRSAVISEELNRKFEKFEEKDYAGLLDLSKIAYIKGKKAKYINSNDREAFLKLNADNAIYLAETNFSVFVRNSSKENEKNQLMKQYAFAMAQNSGKAMKWLELIDSENTVKTKEVLRKIEFEEDLQQQQNFEQEQETKKYIQDSQTKIKQEENETEKYKADKSYQAIVDAATIRSENNDTSNDYYSDDGIELKRDMNEHRKEIDNKNIKIQQEKLNLQNKQNLQKQKESN